MDDLRENFHGVEVADPYRWLEDTALPETQEWVREQDQLARKVLSALPFRDALYREFLSLAGQDTVPLPSLYPPRAPPGTGRTRYFHLRLPRRAQQPVLFYRDGPRGRSRAVVDPRREGPGSTTSILQVIPSWSGSKVVFGLSVHGSDRTALRVRSVGARRDLEKIPDIRYANVAWLHDGSGFYYSTWPEPGPKGPQRSPHVFFHGLGTSAKSDRPLFGQVLDARQSVADLVLDPEDRGLLIAVERLSSSSDLYYLDRTRSEPVRPLVTGLGALFLGGGSMVVRGGLVICVTDHRAPRRRVVAIPIARPDEDSWRELVPEAEDVLDGMALLGGRLVLRYLRGAASRLEVRALDGTRAREIPLPGLGTVFWPFGEFEGEEAVFTFSSFEVPPTNFRCRLSQGRPTVLDRSLLRSPRPWLTTRQVRCRSRDGTEVPMFLVHRRRFRPNGRAPALLEGYGGFGLSYLPFFEYSILPFVRDGGVYAVANLRGGGEYGKPWHEDGKRERKQNVFDDFAAAAEWLVGEGYSDSSRLAIKGRSNGGLLVGALLTQRPELFRASVCGAPVLDMLRYHRFDGGALWEPEYGCADEPQAFEYLWKYSPYHRVRDGVSYPATLITTADTDTRVNPLHARKMAARLQAATSADSPILLRTEHNAGHGFGRSVRQVAEELADTWSFVYDQLGLAYRASRRAG